VNEIPHPGSKPGNRLIADLLFRIKLIGRWGSVTMKIIRVCRDLGVPEPEFHEQDEEFIITFWRSLVNVPLDQPDLLNERQKLAIEFLKTDELITSSGLAQLAGYAGRTDRQDISILVA
jgi:ATP-dependent DNA helicase RecG